MYNVILTKLDVCCCRLDEHTMCSWRSAFFALVTCVLLLEGQSALKSRISPSSLASSQTTSTSDTRQDQVIRSFENSLLKMFGLSSRPRPKRKVHIPEYILELYKQAVAANQEVYSPYEEDELDEDLTSARSTRPRHPLAGTTVRGFYHQGNYPLPVKVTDFKVWSPKTGHVTNLVTLK